jgi:hypothetical protein
MGGTLLAGWLPDGVSVGGDKPVRGMNRNKQLLRGRRRPKNLEGGAVKAVNTVEDSVNHIAGTACVERL